MEVADQALTATRASKRIAFLRECSADALELVKDIVALANSGGGVVVIGVEKDGAPSGRPPRVDLGELMNRVAEYTGEHFDEIEIREADKRGAKVALVVVDARTGSPLVFEKHTAVFERGTLYFRHGARSEPAVARDLTRFATAEAARSRRDLLRNMRKVSAAPSGSEVIVVPPHGGPENSVERFRVVDDPDAPALARTDFDVTHPYRQTELLRTINERVGERIAGPYEIQCVRRVYNIDNRPEFFHRPRFGSPQYSDAFVSWLITEHQRDPEFFEKAKRADRDHE